MPYVKNYAECKHCGWRMWIKPALYLRCSVCKQRIEIPPKSERL